MVLDTSSIDIGITSLIAVFAVVGVFSVMKYMLSECKARQTTFEGRLDKHGDDIVALNTKAKLSITAKDVDDKFVSKELFRQLEKHIDSRFDDIQEGQAKILMFIQGHMK